MLRSLEKALGTVRAKGNAVFAGETHYCDLVVAVVEDDGDRRSFVVENGVRYYRADIGPDPEIEPWDLPGSESERWPPQQRCPVEGKRRVLCLWTPA